MSDCAAIKWVRDEVKPIAYSQTCDSITVPIGDLSQLVEKRDQLTAAVEELARALWLIYGCVETFEHEENRLVIYPHDRDRIKKVLLNFEQFQFKAATAKA